MIATGLIVISLWMLGSIGALRYVSATREGEDDRTAKAIACMVWPLWIALLATALVTTGIAEAMPWARRRS